MTIDTTIADMIRDRIREENDQKTKDHTLSGKLSASILGWATQWQVLKYLQVPTSAYDDYTLCKFKRGEDVESFAKRYLNKHESQVKVEYEGCIGYLDILLEGVPHEVKSVTNMKFKHLTKNGQADPQHKLQGAYYALGLGLPEYVVDYIASDDYRILSFKYETSEMKQEIDTIISLYNTYIEAQKVPLFEPRYSWQSNQLYNSYPEFANLNADQIQDKLRSLDISWKTTQ